MFAHHDGHEVIHENEVEGISVSQHHVNGVLTVSSDFTCYSSAHQHHGKHAAVGGRV